MPYKKLGENDYENLQTQTNVFNKRHKSENGFLLRNFYKDLKDVQPSSPKFTNFSQTEKTKLLKVLKKRNGSIPDWKKEELTGRIYRKPTILMSPSKTARPSKRVKKVISMKTIHSASEESEDGSSQASETNPEVYIHNR